MRAIVMIVADVVGKDSPQMALVECDDVVEQVAAAASHPALGNSVLPRALDRGLHASDAHRANGGRNFPPVFLIVIKEEESGS